VSSPRDGSPHAYERLSASLLAQHPRWSAADTAREQKLPERVIQFGEGNFLRGFVDWMLEHMNRQGLFQGRAVLVQPIRQGLCQKLNEQDGLYTVLLRGTRGEAMTEACELVTSVSRCVDAYADFAGLLRCAEQPELRFVVSNPTEAGITTDAEDRLDARPSASFPGKLTQFLYARYRHFAGDPARGMILLPCELIERNGDALLHAVLELSARWQLPEEFASWLRQSCVFANTLVDRIITGYPQDEAEALAQRLGYQDDLIVAGELFHAWVIESPRSLEEELPLARAGLNVIWTHDLRPYRERKVRILNGAHTVIALAVFLAGKDTVRESMLDPAFRAYVEGAIYEEILATLSLPAEELSSFAASVLERFESPFIRHRLLSISLNSVSKYKARVLGTVLDNQRKLGRSSPRLAFALAALIAFYRGDQLENGALTGSRGGQPYEIRDDLSVLEFFAGAWLVAAANGSTRQACGELVSSLLARHDFWGHEVRELVPEFGSAVSEHLHAICSLGVRPALDRLLQAGPAYIGA
jgi:tagaturonate reductase